MHFRYNRTVAPATTPISVEEAKRQLREVDNDYDTEIAFMVSAATEHADGPTGVLGRCMVSQTWTVGCDFPAGHGPASAIPIKLGYLQSVVSVSYRDAAGELQTLSSNEYAVIAGENGCIYPVSGVAWPDTSKDFIDPVTITVVVGYPDAGGSPAEDGLRANIPDSLRHAFLMHVSHMFEIRDSVALGTIATKIPQTYDALIAPYRITGHGDK